MVWGERLVQVLKQLASVCITYAIAGGGTFLLILLLDKLIGIRVAPEVENMGLDSTEHDELGYGEQGL
jgi:Amt family ammonium transporter